MSLPVKCHPLEIKLINWETTTAGLSHLEVKILVYDGPSVEVRSL